MISFQNEAKARKLVDFYVQEDDGTIRKATAREEFVLCVKVLNIPKEKVFLDSIDTQCYYDKNDKSTLLFDHELP